MSSYYKHVALSPSDLNFVRDALDEAARQRHLAGHHVAAAGCNDTRQRIDGQIREQQTPDERAADLRRELTGPADDDSKPHPDFDERHGRVDPGS